VTPDTTTSSPEGGDPRGGDLRNQQGNVETMSHEPGKELRKRHLFDRDNGFYGGNAILRGGRSDRARQAGTMPRTRSSSISSSLKPASWSTGAVCSAAVVRHSENPQLRAWRGQPARPPWTASTSVSGIETHCRFRWAPHVPGHCWRTRDATLPVRDAADARPSQWKEPADTMGEREAVA
jgi:hypothetical protein